MNMKFETLYARDSKGKVLKWNIGVQRNGSKVDIKKSYGEYNGGQTIRWQRDIKGKNIGKSNETSPYEQAIFQAKSTIERKKKAGYLTYKEVLALKDKGVEFPLTPSNATKFVSLTEDSDEIYENLMNFLPRNRMDAEGFVKPMKCQQYYRSSKNWIDSNGKLHDDRKYFYLANPNEEKETGSIITKFPCMGQPKYNGVRATIQLINDEVVIKSKEGLKYTVPNLMLNIEAKKILSLKPDLVLDGELYIHGESLQDIASAVKKPNLNTARLQYILFDLAIPVLTNKERYVYIRDNIKPIVEKTIGNPIQIAQTVLIPNDRVAQEACNTWIKRGYEGAIFRQFHATYAFGKRPQSMTKLKRVISYEFPIIGVVPQKKDPTKGNFVCTNTAGAVFHVTPTGTDEYKRRILREVNTYKGKLLTCVFYEWTNDAKPFHIIDNVVRDYE